MKKTLLALSAATTLQSGCAPLNPPFENLNNNTTKKVEACTGHAISRTKILELIPSIKPKHTTEKPDQVKINFANGQTLDDFDDSFVYLDLAKNGTFCDPDRIVFPLTGNANYSVSFSLTANEMTIYYPSGFFETVGLEPINIPNV